MNALPAFAEASAGRLFPFDATEVAAELRAAEIRLATSLSAARRSAATSTESLRSILASIPRPLGNNEHP